MRLRVPEIFLGALLAVAIFAMGMLFTASQIPSVPAQQIAPDQLEHGVTGTTWLTKDAAGFFTFVLGGVGAIQALLFWVQLRLIRETLGPTRKAADAAMESANALVSAESARLLIFPTKQTYWNAAGVYAAVHPNSPDMGQLSEDVVAWFKFKNYGKTPAVLKDVSARLEHSVDPPAHVPMGGFMPMLDLPLERVIVSGRETHEMKAVLPIKLTLRDAIAISRGEHSIWLIGYLVYDDVFDRECTQRFLYKLRPDIDGFIRYYDKSTYRTAA